MIVLVVVKLAVCEPVMLPVMVLEVDGVKLNDALEVTDVLTARTEAESSADGEEEMLAEIVADAEVDVVRVSVSEDEGDVDAQKDTVDDAEITGDEVELTDTVRVGDDDPLALIVLVDDTLTERVPVAVTVRLGDKLELVDTEVEAECVLVGDTEFVKVGDTETETVVDVDMVEVVEGEKEAVDEPELVVDDEGVCVPVDVTLVLAHAVDEDDGVGLDVPL